MPSKTKIGNGARFQSASAVLLSPVRSLRHIVKVMLREVALLPEPIPWATLLLETS